MKKFLCWLLGHKWQPYNGNFYDPHCVRCNKHVTLAEIFKQAGGE